MSVSSSPYAKLEASLGARYSDNTKHAFLGQAQRFMHFAGVKAQYDKMDVLAYIDDLVRAGYKESSIITIIAGVRALFAANGWHWPLAKRDMHLGLAQEDSLAPIMSVPDVAATIAVGRRLERPLSSAVCMATMYGLRAAEIASAISAGSIGRWFEISTAKTGRKRTHLVLPELEPYLNFNAHKITVDGVHKMFKRVMVHVRPSPQGEGWHSIRRALVTGLLEAGVSGVVLHRWMGWRMPPSEVNSVMYRYYRREGKELDSEVYAKHPFLQYWR